MIQAVILLVLLGFIPMAVGGIPVYMEGKRGIPSLPFRWVCGQFLLWAGFQLICVPLVIQEREFGTLVTLYQFYILALLLLAAAMGMRYRAKTMSSLRQERAGGAGRSDVLLWLLFWGLLLFQLVQAVRMTYGDGDDAYYVAVSTITNDADTMYRKLPYTGGATELDVRHGLAPFPIWISFLARMSGVPAVTVAHVAVPLALIPMSYMIFYLIGRRLFPKGGGRLPLFLIFTEILVLFGDYSFYTVENFMIARSRQGKAALGSLVIPFVLYLLLVMLQRLQEKKKLSFGLCLMLVCGMTAACLCSTLGALLLCMLVGVTGVTGAVCYKKKGILLPMAACCLPCIGYALVYLMKG